MDERAGKKRVKSKTYIKDLDNLKKVLEEERRRSTACLERIKYLQAEFENHIKRIEHEADEKIKRGNERFIARLLPALDDLERAIELGNNIRARASASSQLLDGVRMVLENMLRVLKDEGLEEIKALGEAFNPSRHEAVGHVFDSGHTTNTIVRELRKGYMFNGYVLRPSLVEVVKSEDTKSSR